MIGRRPAVPDVGEGSTSKDDVEVADEESDEGGQEDEAQIKAGQPQRLLLHSAHYGLTRVPMSAEAGIWWYGMPMR